MKWTSCNARWSISSEAPLLHCTRHLSFQFAWMKFVQTHFPWSYHHSLALLLARTTFQCYTDHIPLFCVLMFSNVKATSCMHIKFQICVFTVNTELTIVFFWKFQYSSTMAPPVTITTTASPTQTPDDQYSAFQSLATKTVEAAQTGRMASLVNLEILSIEVTDPEPPRKLPKGWKRATPEDGKYTPAYAVLITKSVCKIKLLKHKLL